MFTASAIIFFLVLSYNEYNLGILVALIKLVGVKAGFGKYLGGVAGGVLGFEGGEEVTEDEGKE
eukprot:4496555-Ditylum_brightwellii.AAC.1